MMCGDEMKRDAFQFHVLPPIEPACIRDALLLQPLFDAEGSEKKRRSTGAAGSAARTARRDPGDRSGCVKLTTTSIGGNEASGSGTGNLALRSDPAEW